MDSASQEIKFFFAASLIAIFTLLLLLLFAILAYNRKLLKTQKENFNQILDATEIETQRIGQNLHDDLGPLLASVKLSISGTLLGAELDSKYQEILEDGKIYVTQAIHSIRDHSHNLNAANFEIQSFFEILQSRIESLNLSGEWTGKLKGYNNIWEFQHTAKLMLFRICNELIYNSIKHSGGDEFLIDFKENQTEIQLIYTDNGKKQIEPNNVKGIGMNGIHSRVNYLSGKITLVDQMGFQAVFTFPKSNLLK